MNMARSSTISRVVGAAALFLAGAWIFFGAWALTERDELIRRNGAYSYQLSYAVAENLGAVLGLTQFSLEAANRLLTFPLGGDGRDLVDRLNASARELHDQTDGLVDLVIWREDGVAQFILSPKEPLDLAIIQAAAALESSAAVTDSLILGLPAFDVGRHEWLLSLTLERAGARLGAALHLGDLIKRHDKQRMTDGGTIGFLRGDGKMLSRAPFDERFFGRDVFAELDFPERWVSLPNGTYIDTGRRGDGVHRLGSFIRLEEFQAIIFVAVSMERVLEPWRRRVMFGGGGMVLLSLLTLCGAAYLIRLLERAEATHRRFVDVTETASDLAWETDEALRFTFVSDPHSPLVGDHGVNVLGKKVNEIGWEPLDEDVRNTVRSAMAAQRPFSSVLMTRTDGGGGSRTAVISGRPYLRQGKFAGYRGVLVDMTEQIRETKARERQAERNANAGKLEALGRLAGGIAHDFNNLLGAILGFGHFLLQDIPSGGVQRRYAERIVAAGQRGRGLIQRILTFSRRATGTYSQLAVAEVVRETVDLLRIAIPTTTTLIVEDEGRDAMVIGDHGLIAEALLSLCVNAGDALDDCDGEVRISVKPFLPDHPAYARLLNVSAEDAFEVPTLWSDEDGGNWASLGRLTPGPHVSIRVADTGHGMSREVMSHLFDLFFSTKMSRNGTGLGLAVVKRVAMDHSGAVIVTSACGRGTVFELILPRAPTASDDERSGDERSADEHDFEFDSASAGMEGAVLVVGNDADFEKLVVTRLCEAGISAFFVDDIEKGVAAIGDEPTLWDALIVLSAAERADDGKLTRRLGALSPSFSPIIRGSGNASRYPKIFLKDGAEINQLSESIYSVINKISA